MSHEVLDRLEAEGHQEVTALRAALRRLETGTYGLCESCGESITAARLEAMPHALRDISDPIDQQLVTDALQMALGRRQPDVGLMHQSDRGSQSASHAYRELLAAHGIACSMSGKGEW